MTMVRADERLANLGVVYNSKITPGISKQKLPLPIKFIFLKKLSF